MAWTIATIWLSLKLVSNAQPRWPDVPNTTRCEAIATSGFFPKNASMSLLTSSTSERSTSVPARGSMDITINRQRLSHHDMNLMLPVVVQQRNASGKIANFPVKRQTSDAGTAVCGIVDEDFVDR